MATVKRLMDSVLKQVEEDVYVEQSKKTSGGKGVVSADSGIVQPAKRVKREDSETSSERKAGKSVRTSTESSSDSDSDTDSSSESSGSSSDDSDATSEEVILQPCYNLGFEIIRAEQDPGFPVRGRD